MMQKRAVAIHDISCVGRCSLTVAVPVLSAAGIETSVLPTAVLSTHTGEFTGYTYRDLTDDMLAIAKHWKSLGLHTDAIYTGFLGSYSQIDIVCRIIDMLADEHTVICVDPVMADNGELYTTVDRKFPSGIKKLIEKADILIPNITEAALLTDIPYSKGPYTKEEIYNLLKKLSALGPEQIILTGAYFDNENFGAAYFDKVRDKAGYRLQHREEGIFYGTGDLFASALLGAVMNNIPIEKAVQTAVDYTSLSIKRTIAEGRERRYGVNFEAGIGQYIEQLKRFSGKDDLGLYCN